MRAVEQSAGGKLFHHVVESDKVAAGILKEVNRIKLPGGFGIVDPTVQFANFAKEEENFSRRRDELAATKAEVQDTLAMLDHQKAEQIWYTYRQLCRNYATVCR